MMEPKAGDLSEHSLRELLRSLFLERASGVLEVSVDGSKRRLFFRRGELHLPPTNPLAAQLVQRLQKGGQSPEVKEVMGRMAGVMAGWRDGVFTFEPRAETIPEDAVGPLPTAELVMATATLGRSDSQLLEQLGGVDALLVSLPPEEERLQGVRLDSGEIQLLDQLSQPQVVADVLRGFSRSRREALEKLCRLEALELIQVQPRHVDRDSLVNPEVLRRFTERVVRGLATRPVDLDATTHRARLAELLGRLGEVSHYELLGIDAGAVTDEVHTAYEELSRLVHPIHATHLGLQGREEAMRLLFERATEAYLMLSDPDRRRRYNREIAVTAPSPQAVQEERDRRSREAARQYYLRSREMVEEEEYHYALELLRQAVKADPQAEHYALMAEVQQHNPKWLHHAADSYRQAIQLAPDNVSYRLALGELFERLEDPQRARAVYRSVLIRHPDHPDATHALARLESLGEGKRSGFFSRLFGGE